MLDNSSKEQVKSILSSLSSFFLLDIYVSDTHADRDELIELLNDISSCSEKIQIKVNKGDGLEFNIWKDGIKSSIKFRMIPNGHEFSTLLLALLNLDLKGKNFPDEFTQNRIKALKGKINITSYVSLTCTNCPDVVQALNLMTVINPNIQHEIVDGSINQEEVEKLKIQAVPSIYADKELIHSGRVSLGELLDKLEARYGTEDLSSPTSEKEYDVLIIGGGPSGSSAAIYSARKGLKVAILAEQIGGQVKETVGIENLISVPKTTGHQLSLDLKTHIQEYPIDIFENRSVIKVGLNGNKKVVSVKGGETYTAPALIIATGASWKKLNIEGEAQYIGKGIAFCPHCDGPFYKGKHTAVIGGGNSGIEAAIDLAGICSKVTVIEFLDDLKADNVLKEKLKSLPNVDICVSSQTLEFIGYNEKLSGIKIKDRKTEKERIIDLDGVFIQIGLTPNSSIFNDLVNTNSLGEIEIDAHCRTNIPGIYAAGDVSTVPYKQIIISMGEGAKAALSAFEDRIRGII
ncbi:alkyl hydroperoxide reductase subunit F [Bacteroidales bacterium OttesenSCG-928-M06]|nr:alkyl hydroperoxide reductase subunit F [Bacteroidales bacterium OttesenSCG-928-M06]